MSNYPKNRKKRVPLTLAQRTAAFEKRFHARVDRSGGPDACWPWQGPLFEGYGAAARPIANGRTQHRSIHVVAWALANGRWPSGREQIVRHLCNNRACANPRHLRLGSQLENVHDSIRAETCAATRKRRLTDDQVREIRQLWAIGGWSCRRLGARFGINMGSIHYLVTGKTYLNVR